MSRDKLSYQQPTTDWPASTSTESVISFAFHMIILWDLREMDTLAREATL